MILKEQITEKLKTAMKAREQDIVLVIRSLQAAIKSIEIDTRAELDDVTVLSVLEKQIKQRKESISAFEQAGRAELVAKEQAEINVLQQFLPAALSQDELVSMIDRIIVDLGATSIRDMGKVMNQLRPQIAGRADPAAVSSLIKSKLNA